MSGNPPANGFSIAVDGRDRLCAAGSKELFDQAQPLLDAMGKESYYLGEVLSAPGCLSAPAITHDGTFHSVDVIPSTARSFVGPVLHCGTQVGAGAKAKIVINMVMGEPLPPHDPACQFIAPSFMARL